VSLDYATEHLTQAVRSLAVSEQPLEVRLQEAWDEQVQLLWMKPCLPADLLREFRGIWHRYTAPSDDRTSTRLRRLTHEELESAIDEMVFLLAHANAVAAQGPDVALATLADLE
jgi:hypothetical protein